jgi:cell division protein FtsW (lipid II flippase)
VCWLAGAPTVPLLAATGGASVLGALIIAATPFRRARITAFLHPLRCDTATAYHICQSLLALGSGGMLGRGLGDGVQKAGYLPAPYTDSIFAVIGEELGLWGALLVMALVGVLLWRGMRVAHRAPDRFGALLAGGITCWLVVQAILNIGSCVAALPFTGVPLPFVSFGGSSLMVALAAVGIVLNIAGQSTTTERNGKASGRMWPCGSTARSQ